MYQDARYIKGKQAYTFSEVFTALAGNQDRIIRLPAQSNTFFGCWLDLTVKVVNAGSVNLFLFDGSSGTNGTQFTPLNRMRLDIPPSCPVTLFAVTVPTDGTQLNVQAAAASQPAEVCGYVLKPATNYIVRLAPTSTPTGSVTFDFRIIPNFDFIYKHLDY